MIRRASQRVRWGGRANQPGFLGVSLGASVAPPACRPSPSGRVPSGMRLTMLLLRALPFLTILAFLAAAAGAQKPSAPIDVRVAAWDVQGIRTRDLDDPEHPRLRKLAEVIQ